jgi:hypothetical protein
MKHAIEINEDGSNIPVKLQKVFNQFNEDFDGYEEMKRLVLLAEKIGYSFSFGLDSEPTEFWKLDENDLLFNWISNFKDKNEYNPISLKPYNDKFNIEFNYYLHNSNFSIETIINYSR